MHWKLSNIWRGVPIRWLTGKSFNILPPRLSHCWLVVRPPSLITSQITTSIPQLQRIDGETNADWFWWLFISPFWSPMWLINTLNARFCLLFQLPWRIEWSIFTIEVVTFEWSILVLLANDSSGWSITGIHVKYDSFSHDIMSQGETWDWKCTWHKRLAWHFLIQIGEEMDGWSVGKHGQECHVHISETRDIGQWPELSQFGVKSLLAKTWHDFNSILVF